MSIASEISRLQGAKADIKTAIEGKGVTVPSATKLDGYADLVDAIPQGSTPTGTKQISVTSNGTQTENVSGYASAQLNVAVPNSYSAGDEGKVVSNGALVAQGSDTVTTNDTYDTTLINSLTVNVSGGGGSSAIQLLDTITVPQNTRAVQVNLEDYQSYNFLFVYLDNFTLTSTDWLYVVKNDTSGGFYSFSKTDHSGIVALQYNKLSGQDSALTMIRGNGGSVSSGGGLFNYLYLYCYAASINIVAGSKIKIYGGNYADM